MHVQFLPDYDVGTPIRIPYVLSGCAVVLPHELCGEGAGASATRVRLLGKIAAFV